jgi:hypothetical protein
MTMHDIHMAEVTEDFARCWNAAGLHIQNQTQGPIQSWLRSNLTPPFLEHLSFRLGNQLFYLQLEDVDGDLETPGNRDGLLAIADGCAGHACVMPMRRVGPEWEPAEPGWGLLDARTRKPVNPVALISDEKVVMTDWELQDMAVQVVRGQLAQEGRELMSWNSDPHVNPSIWFVGDAGPEWVVVRAARYPEKDAALPNNHAEMKAYFDKLGHPGHFASVAIASADDPFDPHAAKNGNFMPLYRGYGMHIRYEGLQKF